MSKRKRLTVVTTTYLLAVVLTAILWATKGSAQVTAWWGALGGMVPAALAVLAWTLAKPFDAVDHEKRLRRYMAAVFPEYERLQGIHDPWPMPVALRVADLPMDRWEVIVGIPGDVAALAIDGDVGSVAKVFEKIPSRRMVLVGPGGAGKTTAARRLAASSPADGPIPVIVPLATWDIPATGLRKWIIRWISQNLEPLLNLPRVVEQLMIEGRLLLILDGFDEIPAYYRSKALVEINRMATPIQQLVLTSRPDEYADATLSGEVLRAAAVLELQPLGPKEIWSYLGAAASSVVADRWQEVRERREANAALLQVLSLPLFLSMARELYTEGFQDPRGLLAVRGNDIEDVLLGAYLKFVLGGRSPVRRSRAAARRLARVERTLEFMAKGTVASKDPTIASWRLTEFAPRFVIAGLFGASIGILAALGMWIFFVSFNPNSALDSGGAGFVLPWLSVTAVAVALSVPRPRPNPHAISLQTEQASQTRSMIAVAITAIAVVMFERWVFGVDAADFATATIAVAIGIPWLFVPTRAHRPADPVDRHHRLVIGITSLFVALLVDATLRNAHDVATMSEMVAAATMCGYANRDRASQRVLSVPRMKKNIAWLGLALPFVLLASYEPGVIADVVLSGVDLLATTVAEVVPGGKALLSATLVLAIVWAFVNLGDVLAQARSLDRQPRRIAPRLRNLPEFVAGFVSSGAGLGGAAAFAIDILRGFSTFVTNLVAAPQGSMPGEPVLVADSTLEGFAYWFWHGPFPIMPFAMIGGTIGLIFALASWLQTPIDTARSVDHRAVLRADRGVFVIAVAVTAGVCAAIGVPLLGPSAESGKDVLDGLGTWAASAVPQAAPALRVVSASRLADIAVSSTVGFLLSVSVVGVPLLLYLSRNLAWPQYRAAHLWLAVRRQIPFRLNRFLNQMHSTGVLREVGGAYQFRHDRIAVYMSYKSRSRQDFSATRGSNDEG